MKVLIRLDRLYEVSDPDQAWDQFNASMASGDWMTPDALKTRTTIFPDVDDTVWGRSDED